MIKVLIADSDAEIIKNFQTYIKTSFPEIRNVRVVSDPRKELMETIKDVSPQLIIADVRFFGVSSVQKIRSIYERYPAIRFILYGTYSDSEYMRKAMEYGVIDYIYRPIKPADLHKCLVNALAYFKKQEENKKREQEIIASYNEKKYLFETIFLMNLVKGRLSSEAEIFYSFKYFDIPLKPEFTVFVVHIDSFQKIILAMEEKEKHLISYKLLLIMEKKLRGKNAKAFIDGLDKITVIIGGVDEKSGLGQLVDLCENIKNTIHAEINCNVSVGIGRAYEKAADIAVSYKEAKGALNYRFLMGYNTVIHILFADPLNNITYRYPDREEARLVHIAPIGEYEYIMELLREIFQKLKQCEPLPEMYLSKVIMNLLISINRSLNEQNIKIDNHFTSFFPSREVLQLGDDLDEAFEYLSAALKNFCEHIVESRARNNVELIEKTKAYIDARYYEAFSITKVATALGTTPEFLNKTFEEREGRNMLDYTISVRTAEAKRLMRESKLNDDMIAAKVGYDDGRHFRSVFRKYENMSTGEYRAQFSLYNK